MLKAYLELTSAKGALHLFDVLLPDEAGTTDLITAASYISAHAITPGDTFLVWGEFTLELRSALPAGIGVFPQEPGSQIPALTAPISLRQVYAS